MVATAARCLSDAGKSYPIGEPEMLVIVYGLTKLCCHLYDIEFIVITDHANNANIVTKLKPSDRVARWLLYSLCRKNPQSNHTYL